MPRLKIRSSSDSKLTPRHPSRNGVTTLLPGQAPELALRGSPVFEASSNKVSRPDVAQSHAETTPARPSSPSVFRTLESYILDCFADCSALNTSFFPIRPHPTSVSNSATSRPNDDNMISAAIIKVSKKGDGKLAEPDAKTLLLGDVAENGSWWAGNRTARVNDYTSQARDKSPESR